MKLEPASDEEKALVWAWANDPMTRANSFNQDWITWEEHSEWFDAQTDLWIGWVPVGSARLDDDGEISVNIAPEHRRRGYGAQLIRAASLPNSRARIKVTNGASIRAFEAAGYTEISCSDGVVEMVWPGLH